MRDDDRRRELERARPEGHAAPLPRHARAEPAACAADGLRARADPWRGRGTDAGAARHRQGLGAARVAGAAGVHVVSALQDLAENFVLGLLDAAEQAEVAARVEAPATAEDRALAAEVGAARDRLLPLDLTAAEPAARARRLGAARGAAWRGRRDARACVRSAAGGSRGAFAVAAEPRLRRWPRRCSWRWRSGGRCCLRRSPRCWWCWSTTPARRSPCSRPMPTTGCW